MESREARLARIRANRGTPEREAKVAAIKAEQEHRNPSQPEGPVVEGFACELRAGDWVVAIGGKHAGVSYKRYRIGDVVDLCGQTERQRTRGHVVFRRLGHYQLHTWYPVRYVRPEA